MTAYLIKCIAWTLQCYNVQFKVLLSDILNLKLYKKSIFPLNTYGKNNNASTFSKDVLKFMLNKRFTTDVAITNLFVIFTKAQKYFYRFPAFEGYFIVQRSRNHVFTKSPSVCPCLHFFSSANAWSCEYKWNKYLLQLIGYSKHVLFEFRNIPLERAIIIDIFLWFSFLCHRKKSQIKNKIEKQYHIYVFGYKNGPM